MDDVFLSPSEDEFVGRIVEELEHFMEQGQHHRVLLFPPLSSRLRYLIHRTVENMELLSSFSVGEGWRRRTVICHSAVRLPTEPSSDPKAGPNPSRMQRPPAQPWGRGGRGARLRHPGDPHGDSGRASVGSGRISRPPRRKPERAPFVPRGGGRKKANWRERESPGDGEAAPGGENGPRNSGREQQELGRAGGSPGRQQEPEHGPGKGSAERPRCEEEEVPSLGNGGDSCEHEGRDGDCSHSSNSAHKQHLPQAGGEEEPSHGSTNIPEHNQHPPQAGGEEEPSHGSTNVPEHNQHPPQAGGEELSQGSTITAEGREFQAQPQEEKRSSRDSRGSECGRSSVPLENHGDSRTVLPVPAPGVMDPPVTPERAVTAPGVPAPGVTAPGVTAPGVPVPPVPAPGVPVPPVPAPPDVAPQAPQSSSSQPHPAEQHSCNSQGVAAVPSPSAGQVEQEALQKVLEGPAEAVAAPELVQTQRKEEEEDKEGSGVAEALRRGLDLAAGDREGTRQSGPEDDCTAELLAEIVGNLAVKDISIERISVDYSGFGEAPVSEGDLAHVTEIYDFPSALRTEDLLEMFSDFHESGFKLQWVDDTHALGIFSSPSTASQALGRRYPCLKIRPLLHASKQAKVKALQRPKLLQLGKERPQTDTAVARRLLSHALGWRQRQQEPAGSEDFQPEPLEQEE